MRGRIIAEIRRLAEANEGQPPGCQIFEAETGIRYAEWYGIHWARWRDALTEAGYAPNTIQTKLDADAVLQKVVEAYRHFGRVARDGELRLYGRSHSDVPAHTTISNHFGGKAALIEAVRDWTTSRTEFQDVLALHLPPASALQTKKRAARDGCVYLIQAGQHYKIGRSDEL